MLVLTRRTNEKIVLPTIRTSVQVVAIKPGVVRLGIEAPDGMPIFREEVLVRDGAQVEVGGKVVEAPSELRQVRHELRNRLNTLAVGLALLRRQCQAGLNREMPLALNKMNQELQALLAQVESLGELRPPAIKAKSIARKALLVEDDPNECELLAGFLRLAGYEVATAGDGADALDYLQAAGRPDVMLLDMVLPRCDGPSTVHQIRRDPTYAGMKIFAVTGHEPEEFGPELSRPIIDRWFRKPVNPETLLHELNRELAIGPFEAARPSGLKELSPSRDREGTVQTPENSSRSSQRGELSPVSPTVAL